MEEKRSKRLQLHRKIRNKISGTKDRPRFCVFRSNKHMYAQLIDDNAGKVLLSVSDITVKGLPAQAGKKGATVKNAAEIGKMIAKEALSKKIDTVVFDRGGFVFHGRIKAVAEGAREGGLKF